MRISRAILTAAAAIGFVGVVLAQSDDAGQVPVGNLNRDLQAIERGRAVVVGAVAAESAALGTVQRNCMGCHGIDGRGDGAAAFPRLADQSAWYLYKQLTDFASGARPHEIMSPIAKSLTLRQMEDVAAYYAAQDVEYMPPVREYNPLLIQERGILAQRGSPDRQIQSLPETKLLT